MVTIKIETDDEVMSAWKSTIAKIDPTMSYEEAIENICQLFEENPELYEKAKAIDVEENREFRGPS